MTRKQLTLVMFLQTALGSFAQSSAVKEIDMINNPAKNIADNKTQPGWVTGDKYEAAWKELFKKDL